MNLRIVTITGADDGVDPGELARLTASYPFVEWGILRSKKREGQPRFPSCAWREELCRQLDGHVAAHLCGELSREALADGLEFYGTCPLLYERYQLNGFSNVAFPSLRAASVWKDHEYILQVADGAALQTAELLAKGKANVSALWDQSGGTGKVAAAWPYARLEVGLAGGIGPHNLQAVLDGPARSRIGRFWIDMESGVRTDDRFDLAKVETVLRIAAPFVTRSAA